MTADSLPGRMRSVATSLLAALDEEQRSLAARPFTDDAARRWLEYRPERRPGACLAQLTGTARKAAHRLLATGLSEHAFAQAMAIIALEEVLDRREGGQLGRHSGDYWVSVFGDPAGDEPWSWRFEGHHLSVTMTIAGDAVSPAPVFLGANPACVSYAGRPVSRPLGPEEDLVRALLDAMGPAGRSAAVVASRAPDDIHSATNPRARSGIEPLGVPAHQLGLTARALLAQLVALYLDRLPAELAARQAARDGAELHFAWEGPLTPGARHYYRVQGDDLLIEYDTTEDGNHAHTVLRRPRGDFGDDVLAAHYQEASHRRGLGLMGHGAEYGHGMGPAPQSAPPGGDGRIPFTFRIGVTGHRELDQPDDLRKPIREAIARLLTLAPIAPGAGLALVVVSPLAEGADRLVAQEALTGNDARLEVALPMDAEEYADDFKTEESKEEFRGLLVRASDSWQAPAAPDREEAYERAGRYVADRCDALIAVWDGEKARGRGGTAEIVAYAQKKGVPIAWVHTKAGPAVTYALENSRAELVTAAAEKLRMYNSAEIETSVFDERVHALRKELMPDIAKEIPVDPLGLSRERIADWVFPYFIRADILALRYQRRFRRLSLAIFALAALAVAVVAVQTNFWPRLDWLAAFEVVSLVILLGILVMNRRLRLQDQWISSRFLAERLRSSYFLALAGTGDRRERSARRAYLSDSSEAWIERALTEVSARRPPLDAAVPPVSALRDYLNHYWIKSQVGYQEKTSGRQHTFENRLIRLTEILFSLTLVAAFVHIFARSIHGVWEGLLVVVSIVVPAFGAAVHGISTQRQFRRQSDRYRRMAGVLAQVQADMTDAATIEQVREVAAATERVMREENSDWFGVMRFHDMELIT